MTNKLSWVGSIKVWCIVSPESRDIPYKKGKKMSQLSLFDDNVKVTVTFDGKRYFATIYNWFYAIGDTKQKAIDNVMKRLESEMSYR